MSRGIFLPGDKLLTIQVVCFVSEAGINGRGCCCRNMGWHFAVTESVVSVMIITALGSIGDKPRPVSARAVVCIY